MRTSVARQAAFTGQGSITSAQASVGAAATCPTTGTIFKPADTTRHGAAARPQPESANAHTPNNSPRGHHNAIDFIIPVSCDLLDTITRRIAPRPVHARPCTATARTGPQKQRLSGATTAA
ncbi:hypothetical protein PSAC2689_20495 [Paraburkholderia sacchari]